MRVQVHDQNGRSNGNKKQRIDKTTKGILNPIVIIIIIVISLRYHRCYPSIRAIADITDISFMISHTNKICSQRALLHSSSLRQRVYALSFR